MITRNTIHITPSVLNFDKFQLRLFSLTKNIKLHSFVFYSFYPFIFARI